MPYQRFPFDNLGKGLNLRAKPDAVDPGECIDAMNVVFNEAGAVEQRSGYGKLTEAELNTRATNLEPFYSTGGARQLLASCGTRLEAIGNTGSVVASATGLTNAVADFARFGRPNEESVYAGNGTDTLRKWNGVSWSTPTATVDGEAGKAMPKGGCLAVWAAASNRLVVGGFSTTTGGPNGATSSPDHLYFSEPGDPTSWKTTNYVQLSPGDGEKIKAVVVWRDLLIAFKETKFFVFNQAGAIDAEGNPDFPFRPVEGGAGLVSPRAVTVHPTGVFFMGRHGVYKTTGEDAELLSNPVSPIWEGDPATFYTGGVIAHGSIENCAMTTYNERLYLSFPTSSANDRTLVFDPIYRWWSLTNIPAAAMTSFRAGVKEELAFAYASGGKYIGLHGPSYTNDDGTAIEALWRSGWFNLGNPDVKKIRGSKLWGNGIVEVAVGHDFGGVGQVSVLDFTDSSTDTWGGTEWGAGKWAQPHALQIRERRVATRGSDFSVFLGNRTKDQTFSVHRLEHLVPEVRNPSVTTA